MLVERDNKCDTDGGFFISDVDLKQNTVSGLN